MAEPSALATVGEESRPFTVFSGSISGDTLQSRPPRPLDLPPPKIGPPVIAFSDDHDDESLTLALPRVLIAGASTRAAAFAALRSGFEPVCCDQFADADLRATAEVHPIEGLSLSPSTAPLSLLPGLPIVLTGGMENHLSTWGEIEAQRTLWAPRREAVAAVRDPFGLAETLDQLKQATLELRTSADRPPADGTWMLKPLASAGGRGIRVWDDAATKAETLRRLHYFQRRVVGPVYSALFVADQDVGDVRFVGLTRQWAGCPELSAKDSWWCGNVGPVTLDVGVEFLVRRWGNILKWKFQMTGIYGIDFALDEAGQPWLLEVNPRWTGSAEVLDLACGMTLFADHVGCYSPELGALGRELAGSRNTPSEPLLGRAILYAPHRLQWTKESIEFRHWSDIPAMADLPLPGAILEPGEPVCSLYATGSEELAIQGQLFQESGRVLAEMTVGC